MQVPYLKLKILETAVKELLGKDVNITLIVFCNNNINMNMPRIVSDKRANTSLGCIHMTMVF